jgi:hypothetical protein
MQSESSNEDDDDDEYDEGWAPVFVGDRRLLVANVCNNKEVPGYRLPRDSSVRLRVILKPKKGEATEEAK